MTGVVDEEMRLVQKCKSKLTPDDWEKFQQITGIEETIQFLSRKLHVDSDDPVVNPLLERFMSETERIPFKSIKTRIRDLKTDSRTKDFQKLIIDLTKEITAVSQSDREKDRRLLADLYCLRSEVHRRRHLKVFQTEDRQEQTSFTSALIDAESANHCNPRGHLVRLIKKRLTNTKKKTSSCSWNMKSIIQQKLRLYRIVRNKISSCSPHPTVGSSDDGYRSLSPDVGFRVCHSPAKGRLLRATRPFSPRENVLSESALVFALIPLYISDRCSNCTTRISLKIHKCPRNCPIVYCGIRCYEQALPVHQVECPILGILISENTHFQLNIRFFLLRNTFQGQRGKDLTHHFAKYGAEQRFSTAIRSLYVSTILQQVQQLNIRQDMDNGCPLMSCVLTQRCQIETNSVSLVHKMGSALFPTFSLICNSCQPNVRYVASEEQATDRCISSNSGVRIYLTATEIIDSGTELTIAYTGEPDLEKRRRKLRQMYLFDCFCRRCLDQMRKELPQSVCTPVTECSFCGHRLQSHSPEQESAEEGHKSRSKVCPNNICPKSKVIMDFDRNKRHASDFLSNINTRIKQNMNLCNDPDLRADAKTIMDDCRHIYNHLITQFVRPNILLLDFEIFFSKLAFHLMDWKQSLDWAEKALKTSLNLFDCHRESGLCFFRVIRIKSRRLNRLITEKEQRNIANNLNVSGEKLLFFSEELPDGPELENLMHF